MWAALLLAKLVAPLIPATAIPSVPVAIPLSIHGKPAMKWGQDSP